MGSQQRACRACRVPRRLVAARSRAIRDAVRLSVPSQSFCKVACGAGFIAAVTSERAPCPFAAPARTSPAAQPQAACLPGARAPTGASGMVRLALLARPDSDDRRAGPVAGDTAEQPQPRMVAALRDVIAAKIACGWAHTLLVDGMHSAESDP
jgi:hypothetical protein